MNLGIYKWSTLNRFASADAIVPDPVNPQAYNRYSYVYNNPLLFNDQSGHNPNRPVVLGGSNVDTNATFAGFELLQTAVRAGLTWAGLHYAYQHSQEWFAMHDALWVSSQISNGTFLKRYEAASQALAGYTASTPPPQWDPDNDPDKNQYGAARENYVRQFLRDRGWNIRAETDAQVRSQLGIEGKVADIYGVRDGRFLIGESKGADVGRAVSQLRNTVNGLYSSHASAIGNTEVRLYVNQNAYNNLVNGWHGNGYRVVNGLLEYYESGTGWSSSLAGNAPIQVFLIP